MNAPAPLRDKARDIEVPGHRDMAHTLSQPIRWAVLAAVAGITIFGILAIGPRPEVLAQDRSPVVDVPSEDLAMNAAIARARGTLPTFWASFEAPKASEEGHSLKVRFPTHGNNAEHIWMADVKKLRNRTYSGRFANQPRDLPGKRAGDLIEFSEADITDWMFMRNGKIVGGQTIRLLLKSLPKADAAALRARLEQP
jgi:uncharacterized protein YegJ (DUF2314 family)